MGDYVPALTSEFLVRALLLQYTHTWYKGGGGSINNAGGSDKTRCNALSAFAARQCTFHWAAGGIGGRLTQRTVATRVQYG